jgi:hypothetical protein
MLPWACCAALLTIMALVGRLEAVDGPLFTCTKIFCRLWPPLSMGWVEGAHPLYHLYLFDLWLPLLSIDSRKPLDCKLF